MLTPHTRRYRVAKSTRRRLSCMQLHRPSPSGGGQRWRSRRRMARSPPSAGTRRIIGIQHRTSTPSNTNGISEPSRGCLSVRSQPSGVPSPWESTSVVLSNGTSEGLQHHCLFTIVQAAIILTRFSSNLLLMFFFLSLYIYCTYVFYADITIIIIISIFFLLCS